MKKHLILSLLLASVFVSCGPRQTAFDFNARTDWNDSVLPRHQSFFGWHFDFHAGPDCDKVGRNLTEGMIDTLLVRTKPDYIQVDCKGHPGYSSYPTRVGNPAPGIEKDILKMFREVTRRHNVALYVHYSGVWEERAIALHPEWAAIHADGTRDREKISCLSPYVDELLIPQLKEIAAYGVDGVWVDGDCWAAIPDYSPAMRKRYKAETGRELLPEPGQPGYPEFMELNRTVFREYIARYVEAVKAEYPGFQITSNWAYSSLMAEPVDVDLDYLSGDVAGQNGLYSAAWEARCMAPQGKPWDLMSWGFTYDFQTTIQSIKSPVMLMQEAAQVISQGGGFQVYHTQNRDGSLKTLYYDRMAELAPWVRERQPWCQGSKPLPQIAMWYSTAATKAMNDVVYRCPHVMSSVMNMLLDGRNSVEVLMDHHLQKDIDKYPMVVLAEWVNIGKPMKKLALDYVERGGTLLVIGAEATRDFIPFLGVEPAGEVVEQNIFVRAGENFAPLNKSRVQPVKPQSGTETYGEMRSHDDPRYLPECLPMATIRTHGKGTIAAVWCDMNESYRDARSYGAVDVMNGLIDRLMPYPIVRVVGEGNVHVVPSQLDDRWVIHLINTAGDHSNRHVYSYETIHALPSLELVVDAPRAVRRATLQPDGKRLTVRERDGRYHIGVPPIPVHGMVELTF